MRKNCSVFDCDAVSRSYGMCKKHATRLERHGSPDIVKRPRYNDVVFWQSAILTADGSKCWEWQRCIKDNGYGTVRIDGQDYYAHRYAWFLANGRMPDLFILHSCDNRRCINPNHLREGTQAENIQDAVNRGRNAQGERNGLAKLTEKDVLTMRDRMATETARAVAKDYNITPATLSCIKLRKTWRHI